ncbi:hypothetical protein [Noviherbaspirillum pedocola]|uniref:Uncharacterized protein n=1 Tax=Noviherbaspirillum pedocola TaxID=2801341 RepID=A0A934SRK0_9BURK|nr:hypothetical protein [Noviherbaspirillum pedocola]MBK4733968.1 hypothetical protein [Noviherbaspirillum pedocola]
MHRVALGWVLARRDVFRNEQGKPENGCTAAAVEATRSGSIQGRDGHRDGIEETTSAQTASATLRCQEYRATGAQRMSRERRIDDCDAGLVHIIMVPASIGTSIA